MPNCRIDAELQANAPYANGLAINLTVYGHASRNCPRVHVRVRTSQNGPMLCDVLVDAHFNAVQQGTDPLAPENDGTWSADFVGPESGIPCGMQLWVDAWCTGGDGDCEFHDWRAVRCKNHPGRADPGEDSQPGSGGSGSDWPWPDPPHIICPQFGRAYLSLLLFGLLALAWGISARSATFITLGVTSIALAEGIRLFWFHWCVPNSCYFWGGVLWVFKRATAGAMVCALANRSFAGTLVMIAYGVIGGWVLHHLQRRHCPVPSGRTAMAQLPLF